MKRSPIRPALAVLRFSLCVFLAILGLVSRAAQQPNGHVLDRLQALQQALTVQVTDWRFHQPDILHGEDVGIDDTRWQRIQTGFVWSGENTRVWFRTRIAIPETIQGFPTRGFAIRMKLGVDDDGEVYVDGRLRQQFHWDDGNFILTEHAQPGQIFTIAVRGINGVGTGQLRFCRLTFNVLAEWQPQFDRFLLEADFLQKLATRNDVPERAQIANALRRCEALLEPNAFRLGNANSVVAALGAARRSLLPLQPLIRQYRVTYVGHAHIDMNWLWTWPETIDVCHRTWDSAMKLMDQFPDFGFVQSQPGAYTPIQQQFPEEFARMQAASKRGQWDAVGALWDESDTDMPSGEALARSLFLGQRFFKQNFGQYAETGWLPDSFGHSWQLPQLFQGVGIDNFYHQRCGDGIRFAWWQGPDGSRLLKANTDAYNAGIDQDQLTEPFDNQRRFGLKQSLVVFGVGDHGGGPTREQILIGKSFQSCDLLPQVQFTTADAFFKQLRGDPATASLPIIDTDLQYFDMGCYTTHADMKADVRGSENDLYSGEVLASLAAMYGRPYPVEGFTEAWKPTAFAQFHDIMCGSAIHSTYTWMHEQLAPVRRFETDQIDESLATLTAATDTRVSRGVGKAADPAVVVWNPLSFSRDDAVSVHIDDPDRFRSVYDEAGNCAPVQAADSRTLVFVAQHVPGFGRRVYYLSTAPCPSTVSAVQSDDDSFILENAFSRLTISRETGLMTRLRHKPTGQELLATGQPGDVLQVLGDGGNAWDVHLNGQISALAKDGASVRVVAEGPVYSVVEVVHSYGSSHFVQRITMYNRLPRIDIPTTVDWHEHGQMLKVAFPLNIPHPDFRVGIPYGSIARPHNGQEIPGQKWMDLTESTPGDLSSAMPLEVRPLFNHDSGVNFDGGNRSYARNLFRASGVYRVGAIQVPIQFSATPAGMPDNVACDGQSLPVPAGAEGSTLYLVGASAGSAQETLLTFVMADGRSVMRRFRFNDWVLEDPQSNEAIATFPYQLRDSGRTRDDGTKLHLWLTSVAAPDGRIVKIVLPENRNMHLFAATLAKVAAPEPRFGLTILNDCKYGADVTGGVFRLSLLRSSNDPDPNPDEGLQRFTYALLSHSGDSRAAESEQAGLALNIPLRASLTTQHPARNAVAQPVTTRPTAANTATLKTATAQPAAKGLANAAVNKAAFVTIATDDQGGNLVAGALKHCEDAPGYILRMFETQGRDTTAVLSFAQPVAVEETDLLERPLAQQHVVVSTDGRTVRLPVGHDKIVTLHITGLPDAGVSTIVGSK